MHKKKNLINRVFGKLTVIGEAGKRGKHFYWSCICECGNTVERATTNLEHRKSNYENSCGCEYRKNLSNEMTGKPRKHGQTTNGKWTTDYAIYRAMITRCTNPNTKFYKNYGGRGIAICDRWLKGEDGVSGFECFTRDMGKRPEKLSLDRIDFNGNYEPNNCRWADSKTQGRNTTNTRFTLEKAKEVRDKFSTGNFSKSQLSRDYSISRTNIRDILEGKIWKE